MLIRSNQLTLNEASAILDNGVYLTEAEAALNPVAVPVLENKRLDICTVSYNDIQRVCEDYGCYSCDALASISEASGVDLDHIAVAIDEADVILDPSIVNEFAQYVINPISEYSDEYIFTEACLECFIESDMDYDYLEILTEGKNNIDKMKPEDAMKFFKNWFRNGNKDGKKGLTKFFALKKKYGDVFNQAQADSAMKHGVDTTKGRGAKQLADLQSTVDSSRNMKGTEHNANLDFESIGREQRNKTQASLGDPVVYSRGQFGSPYGGGGADNAIKDGKEALKSNEPGFIAKRVASLRKFYSKFLNQANQEHDQKKISWYKNIARVILNLIDKLLAKLDTVKNK